MLHAGVLIQKSGCSVTGNIRLELSTLDSSLLFKQLVTEPLSPPQLAALSFGPAEAAVFLLNGCCWQLDCNWRIGRGGLQHSDGVPLDVREEKAEMDSNYVFLCGVMWCRFGQQDAGKELLRATNSVDPDMKALAWAMLAKGTRRLRDLERLTPTGSPAILEGNLCG
jgi:hypothetical protein